MYLHNFFSGVGLNGHSKHRGYESSMLSSDIETTSFLESDDDASSRITTTTGRHTNITLGKFLSSDGLHFAIQDYTFWLSLEAMYMSLLSLCI